MSTADGARSGSGPARVDAGARAARAVPATTRRRRAYALLNDTATHHHGSRVVEVALVALIVGNVIAVMLESVPALGLSYTIWFRTFEIVSVLLFSVEYLCRLWTSVEDPNGHYAHPLRGRLRYALTPLAIIDLLAVLPFFLGMILPLDLRFLRVARLLRLAKLGRYSRAMTALLGVIYEEIDAVLAACVILVVALVLAAAGIYLFEHRVQPEHFASIPAAMWWSVTTLTTVGYGDVTPITTGGRFFGGCVMIVGIGMVALPAGILASAFSERLRTRRESYAVIVDRALADGRITEDDRHRLEQARDQLGLSREEALRILSRVAREMLVHEGVCPHCGHVIGRRRQTTGPGQAAVDADGPTP
ncbi:MAG: ion transporter [Gammaproteobacteria bacterium]|nr:ion transporter [Gammaproteobacteria bacterium]